MGCRLRVVGILLIDFNQRPQTINPKPTNNLMTEIIDLISKELNLSSIHV